MRKNATMSEPAITARHARHRKNEILSGVRAPKGQEYRLSGRITSPERGIDLREGRASCPISREGDRRRPLNANCGLRYTYGLSPSGGIWNPTHVRHHPPDSHRPRRSVMSASITRRARARH